MIGSIDLPLISYNNSSKLSNFRLYEQPNVRSTRMDFSICIPLHIFDMPLKGIRHKGESLFGLELALIKGFGYLNRRPGV